MTRISDSLLVQRVDDLLVILDESTGAEITVPVELGNRLTVAINYLCHAEV